MLRAAHIIIPADHKHYIYNRDVLEGGTHSEDEPSRENDGRQELNKFKRVLSQLRD